MTTVPRLQLLPPPGASPGATAVALPDQGEQRVQPVLAAKAIRQGRPEFQQSTIDERQAREQLGNARADNQRRADNRRTGEDRRQTGTAPARSETASGRLINFSRLSSMPFMVQVLGQQAAAGRPQAAMPQTSLSGHRDAALLGSDIYRKAGGEPEILPDDATFVRLAV
ncbi:hypothetical protein [Pelagibius marinus]|uniref:hypothetical protein n=1 Tax=Pelagibius marinus TaxID=2762760 RepID=UPI00187246C4|nr:hypothetical protein [Pelagibius marinus]